MWMGEHRIARRLIARRLRLGLKTSVTGPRFGAGLRWQSRHQSMVSGAVCRISGMEVTSPWQVAQATPLAM